VKLERIASRFTAIRVVVASTLLALAIVAVGAIPAAEASKKEKYEEAFHRTETLAPDGKVYLSNISGNVKILVWNRNEVKIDAVKVSEAGSLEKAKANAALVKIEINRKDSQLDIATKYPEGRWTKSTLSVSVDYILTIPAKAGVTVNNISGNVDAENMDGLVKLLAVSGNITAAKCTNNGVFNAVSGCINLRDMAGDVKARTVSGDISIERVAGSLNVETVSGKVDATDLSNVGSADINVHSGNILFDGALNPSGRYSLETHSGDITVSLPENAAFDFTCWTFSGDINSDFKAVVELSGKLKSSQHDIRGQVNGGGADLSVKTFSGDINLKKHG
jgi:DUF4097 and DUF4098 domain-containing protein YvlB